MAKFRSNYSPHSRGSNSFLVRLIIYGIVLVLLLLYVARYFKNFVGSEEGNPLQANPSEMQDTSRTRADYLPTLSPSHELIHHTFYSLSYAERHEQAEWVAYELTVEQLNAAKHDRYDYFSPDIKIKSRSAIHRDYTGSGYSRGHLAPAADMAFDAVAARECFFMSNISPQVKAFNNGIWRELEENVRDWARKNKKLWVVSGPVLSDDLIYKIGANRVTVPRLFYKVILDYTAPEKKGIAFLIPNERSDLPLENYIVSIDSIENVTSINFFAALPEQTEIEVIENNVDKKAWTIQTDRYSLRKTKWNNQE
ncbi:MAG: DNA/RNA non-specific endonuclease [Saprospiraceae bacterium]|nr:DNA/RNA non-specific endonuclease [Saprospiraceae bacterium]